MMYSRILVPIDGSACSDVALEKAIDLAHIFGAAITLLHTIERPSYLAYAAPDGVPAHLALIHEIEVTSQAVLERAWHRTQASGIATRTILERNKHPVTAILDAEVEHDLIVMGTHGRRGFDRFFLGSVTEGVLRRSLKPLFIVRGVPDTQPLKMEVVHHVST